MEISSPDKVLFPGAGVTKRDLAGYHEQVADRMLPHVRNRLISLVRCPDGTGGDCFFQRHPGEGMPDAIRTATVKGREEDETYLYIDGAEGLTGLVQIGAIEIHIWGAPVNAPDTPDRLVFDLDPGEGVDFAAVKRAARRTNDYLGELGLAGFPLLTGSKGVHVVVPLAGQHRWTQVKAFARAVSRRAAGQDPDRFTVHPSKKERRGKVFIDYLRNDHSQTAIAPYSPRARGNAPVACPVRWDELSRMDASGAFTVESLSRRLASLKSDPWSAYAGTKQAITKEMSRAAGADE